MYSNAKVIGNPIQQFFQAVGREDFSKIQELLAAGVSITSKAPSGGKQILHYACEVKLKVETIKKLIEWGADVNAKTERGCTPLHVAAQNGLDEIMIILIKAGTELEADMKTSKEGDELAEAMKMMIIEGAKGNVMYNEIEKGTTPLQEAASRGQPQAVRVLLAAGANPEYYCNYMGQQWKAIDFARTIESLETREATIYALLGADAAFKEQVS